MTTILGLILSLSLLSSPRINSGTLHQSVQGQVERVATDETTFTVQNTTTISVGMVTVHEADQNSAQIAVTGQGKFTASLTASAVACMVNGQPVPLGTPTTIMVDQHTTVVATWTGNIIVIDQDEKI